jgi:hypothetical protein
VNSREKLREALMEKDWQTLSRERQVDYLDALSRKRALTLSESIILETNMRKLGLIAPAGRAKSA